MTASDRIHEASAEALSLLFVLRRAVARGGHDPLALRAALAAAIAAIRLDDRGRAAGLRADDLRRVRLALIAAADELTQRPGSRCDYSQALLQQEYLHNTGAGSLFSAELGALLGAPRLGGPDVAILEIFAVCLALGVRGAHEPGPEFDALRARVADKLRPSLAAPDMPPRPTPTPWPPRRSPSRLPGLLAALALLFAAAMILTASSALSADAAALRDRLDALTPLPP